MFVGSDSEVEWIDDREDEPTHFEVLVQSTPSPTNSEPNNQSVGDVIPASDEDDTDEDDQEEYSRDKRKRSVTNTPTWEGRGSRGRGLKNGVQLHHVNKQTMFSPQRNICSSSDEEVHEAPDKSTWRSPAPVSQFNLNPTIDLISEDEDGENLSQSLLTEMETPTSRTKGGSKLNNGRNKNSGPSYNPSYMNTAIPISRASTSTPLLNQRRPFAPVDNLDLTAIPQTQSNLNETVDDFDIETHDLAEEDCVNNVQSSLESLSLLEDKNRNQVRLKEQRKEAKLSDIIENFDLSESSSADDSSSADTVRSQNKKRSGNTVNIISSDEDESTEKSETVEIGDSTGSESVNSLFDAEAVVDVDDDDDDEEEDEDFSPKTKTGSQSTKTERMVSQVPTSSRGMSKEAIKFEFKGSVQKTINELARIIEEMPIPDNENDNVELPRYLKVDLYKHQLYGLRWLHWRENQYPGGGILADEMGLGKTLMIISLVLKTKEEKKHKDSSEGNKQEWNSQEKSKHKLVPSQSTLVVCPAGMMAQWEAEITSKTRKMTVVVFHGPKRKTSAAVLAQHDFVITTYQTLGSEIPKDVSNRSPLAKIQWERVVLDEGHIVRNSATRAAHGCSALHANHRWVVTGTPVHNSAKDMFSLVSFLRLIPFDDKKVWDFWIGFKGMNKDQSTRLQTIGKSLLLRRTKDEVNTNDPGRQIPEKTVVDVEVELNEGERLIYDHLKEYAAEQFKNFLKNKEQREIEMQNAADRYVAGARPARGRRPDVNFTHIFTLILRLRQACVLPYLIHTMLDEEDAEKSLDTSDMDEDIISMRNPCFKPNYKSAKIQQLLHDINRLKEKAEEEDIHMDKVIVISQWTKLLDIISLHLHKAGYSVVSITGKQSLDERTEAMTRLNSKSRRPQVMCLSLGAGGVGLNLVGANHVFFMDIHWNPQLELQAQDRVHRFGQTKPVTVTRYVARDTFDERVVALQCSKLELANGILNNTKKQQGGGLSLVQMRTLFEI